MVTKSSIVEFASQIYKMGINPVVDPPDEALSRLFEQAGRSQGPVPVRGRLNGAEFIQTLVKYRGVWRLYVNGQMLKTSGLKVGDTGVFEIEFDPRPREIPVPPKFAAALSLDRSAKSEFDGLTPGRQREILRYLGSLKTQASLERNIERILHHLRGENTDALHAVMSKPKK